MISPSFILELPIKVNDSESRMILRKFEFARQLHNATLGSALGQLQQMRQDPQWKKACNLPKGKERSELFRNLDRQYRLTEYDLHAVIAKHRERSGRKDQLGINETQKIATRVYQSIRRYQLGLGGRPRFKSISRGLHSIEGKTNVTGLKFNLQKSVLSWCKHDYRVIIDAKDDYIQRALQKEDGTGYKKIKYCRLVRKTIKNRERFFLQVLLEGTAPVKHIYAPDSERLSIDPGPQAIAVFSEQFAGKIQIAPTAKVNEAVIRRMQRSMDRSLRRNNEEVYESNGTLKKGVKLKQTKSYKKRVAQLSDYHRRVAATRRCEHGQLANLILSLAGDIRIEKNQWKTFQRGLFGKSLGKSGASNFIERLKSKAESAGLKVSEVKPYTLKLSQYDPYTETYRKKALSERWHQLGSSSEWIQRDVLSALLLQCADIDKEKHIPTKIIETLEGAKQLLRDAGYVVDKPSSNGDHYNRPFASEPKAQTPEEVRLEIICSVGDNRLPFLLRNGSRQKVNEKAHVRSKETFSLND